MSRTSSAVASVGAATATTTETIFEAIDASRSAGAPTDATATTFALEALAKLAACLARVDGARRRSERVSSECSGRSFSRFRRAFASTTRAASATLDACLDAAAAAVSAEDDASNPRWNATMSVAARACAAIRAVATLATKPEPGSGIVCRRLAVYGRAAHVRGVGNPRGSPSGYRGGGRSLRRFRLGGGGVRARDLATARADRREWTHAVVDAAFDALLDRVRVAVAEEKERGETIREDARGEIRDAAPRDAASRDADERVHRASGTTRRGSRRGGGGVLRGARRARAWTRPRRATRVGAVRARRGVPRRRDPRARDEGRGGGPETRRGSTRRRFFTCSDGGPGRLDLRRLDLRARCV